MQIVKPFNSLKIRTTLIMHSSSIAILLATAFATANGFVSPKTSFGVSKAKCASNAPVLMSSFDDEFIQQTPEQTKQNIQDLVDEHAVVVFMKGSKIFPQCGFSSTAVQILNTFNIDFHSGKKQLEHDVSLSSSVRVPQATFVRYTETWIFILNFGNH